MYLAAQNMTGCSHRLSSCLISQSSLQCRFPCSPLCMALLAGLYMRTVRRWRSSGAPETMSAGIGRWSWAGGDGAGTWAVVSSACGIDFWPVRGVCVIMGDGGGLFDAYRTRPGWIERSCLVNRCINAISCDAQARQLKTAIR